LCEFGFLRTLRADQALGELVLTRRQQQMQAVILGFRNSYRVWAALALAALLPGCRRDAYTDAYFDMLNAEKRVLEDRVYEAEYNYEKAMQELEAAKVSAKDGKKPASRTRSTAPEIPLTEPQEGPPDEIPEVPKIELPPGVEEGKRSKSGSAAVRPASAVLGESPALAALNRPLSDDELAAAIVSALDQRVELIRLNPRLTGGLDLDAKPGDDGISVLVEPRNRSGDFVAEAACVSVVLMDPTKSDDTARVARWDLDAQAATRLLHTAPPDRGLLLRLPWPDCPPENKRLHLFVRYLTADGRKIEADREIEINAKDLVADRWTPRQSSASDEPPGGEVPVSWQAKDDQQAEPMVVQALAEAPLARPISESDQGIQPAAEVREAAVTPSEPEAEAVKPHPRADRRSAQRPATGQGRFWKPDR